ncbi:hypothetical protein JCM8097_004589 [Rhodosporidiobolus ruineniae]
MPLFHRTHHTSGVTTSTRSTPTRRRHAIFTRRPKTGNGRSRRQNRIAGLEAARSNPNTSSAASHTAGEKLHSLGARKNHVPLSTRIKRALHIGTGRRRLGGTTTTRRTGGGLFGGRRTKRTRGTY